MTTMALCAIAAALLTAPSTVPSCPSATREYGPATPLGSGDDKRYPTLRRVIDGKGDTVTQARVPGISDLQVGQSAAPSLLRALEELRGKTNGLALVFADGGGGGAPACEQQMRFAPLPVTSVADGVPRDPPPSGATPALDECARQAGAWLKEIRAQLSRTTHGDHVTLYAFMQSGELCFQSRAYGIEGDPIYIGVFADDVTAFRPIKLSPCSLEPEGPAIHVGTESVNIPSSRQAGVWHLRRYPPRACFNRSVSVELAAEGGADGVAFELAQHRLYRATLQLGAMFTDRHVRSFDVRTLPDGQGVLFSRGPDGTGVAYNVSLVLYGFPNYLLSLFGGRVYRGRDVLHDQGLLDRLGLVLGVGLSDPGRRFHAGAAFELVYGLNLVYAAEIMRAPELVGARVGEPFDGAASDIRTRDVWRAGGVFGVTVDLTYVAEVFTGRIRT